MDIVKITITTSIYNKLLFMLFAIFIISQKALSQRPPDLISITSIVDSTGKNIHFLCCDCCNNNDILYSTSARYSFQYFTIEDSIKTNYSYHTSSIYSLILDSICQYKKSKSYLLSDTKEKYIDSLIQKYGIEYHFRMSYREKHLLVLTDLLNGDVMSIYMQPMAYQKLYTLDIVFSTGDFYLDGTKIEEKGAGDNITPKNWDDVRIKNK